MTVGRIPNIEGGIQPTLLTTAGDTLYASSASNPARLGIGTAGQVLTVNSGGTAPEWGSVSSERAINTAKIATSYLKNYTTAALSNVGLTEDVTYYYPIYLPNYAFDRISIRNSSNTTNISYRLGIYNSSDTTGLPTTVYLDAGTVAVTTASTNFEITISTTPPAGYYYLAVNAQTITSGSPELAATVAESTLYMHDQKTTATVNTTTFRTGFSQTGVTGAFATAGTLSPITTNPALIALRMA